MQATTQQSTSKLFTPYKIGDLELPHRIVQAPCTRNRCDQDFNIRLDLVPEYYKQRSSAALLISEGCAISPGATGYPFCPGIFNQSHIDKWKVVTDTVHAKGTKIFCQLWHCGRYSHPSYQPNGQLPASPSEVACTEPIYTYQGPSQCPTPRAVTKDEIKDLVQDFKHASKCAKEAGFDGVEIHGANGYLIDQFLKDGINKRTDEYGGSFENRFRFLDEIIKAINEVWDIQRIGVRLAPTNDYLQAEDSNPEQSFSYYTQRLDEHGLSYIHTQEPRFDLPKDSPLEKLKVGFFKKNCTKNGTPIIGNNGYRHTEDIEKVINNGEADLVAFGRYFISNPDLPERIRTGAPWNHYNRDLFYDTSAGPKGYIDYPTLDQEKQESNSK